MTTAAGIASVERLPSQHDGLSHLTAPLLVPLSSRRYNRQFASLYDYRLRRLKHPRGRLVQAATEKWCEGKGREAQKSSPLRAKYVKRILDVRQGEICFVIGTIYCSMHLKPDVLEELSREQYLPPQPPSEKYADPEKDEFFVEDESGRVRLVGEAVAPDGHLRGSLVTGVVVAFLGTETRSGDFEVADALFAGVPEAAKEKGGKGDGWVALVSGLDVGPSSSNATAKKGQTDGSEEDGMMGYATKEMRLMLFTDWLLGYVGDDEERKEVSQISSLIIAGNSMSTPAAGDEDRPTGRSTTAPEPANSYPTSHLDDFLVDLASCMHVHVLPGERDPTSIALPQQPMHRSLFPKASRFESLHQESNPAWIGEQGAKFLGSSGQNIDDIFKYMVETSGEARLQAACNTLDWGHIAPTAPDTLSCYPLSDRDPFLIEEAPDVYFVGNQDHFASRLYRTNQGHPILVILLPRFATTGDVVLVQPSTLAIKTVHIDSVV